MVHDLTDYLDNAGIKLLVVACNTITVLGTESIRNGYAFDVVGMSKGAELALGVTKTKNRRNGHAFYCGKRRAQGCR